MRLLAMLLWLPAAALSQGYPSLHDVTGVASNDVLNIRSAPDASSDLIGSFAFDARDVEVVRTSGGWGLVNSGEQSGWVSMRYMQAVTDGHWTSPTVGLSCYGTEPFWSLDLSAESGPAGFQTQDGQDVTTSLAQKFISAPGFPMEQMLTFQSDDLDWARLQQTSCNDGMSDRDFGISVDLAVSQEMNSPLTLPNYLLRGCCSVVPAR